MHNDLVELGWTEEQWNLITSAVTEEAQKARVAAQMLPLVGPEDPSTVAVPAYALGTLNVPPNAPPDRLVVDSDPTLFLTTIAVNVYVRSHEAGDPSLKAALGMFRRAANYIARIEDALIFNGRPLNAAPVLGLGAIPPVFTVNGNGTPGGIVPAGAPGGRFMQAIAAGNPNNLGNRVVDAIIAAIGALDAAGYQGPYACGLAQDLFTAICTPNPNLIMPRDRILPFLQGPLLRASAVPQGQGFIVSLSANSVEVVVGSDLCVKYLQTNLEPRYIFRVCERIALRIREEAAIAIIS
jgi:uncharacterized linocin/CFP29 family protein